MRKDMREATAGDFAQPCDSSRFVGPGGSSRRPRWRQIPHFDGGRHELFVSSLWWRQNTLFSNLDGSAQLVFFDLACPYQPVQECSNQQHTSTTFYNTTQRALEPAVGALAGSNRGCSARQESRTKGRKTRKRDTEKTKKPPPDEKGNNRRTTKNPSFGSCSATTNRATRPHHQKCKVPVAAVLAVSPSSRPLEQALPLTSGSSCSTTHFDALISCTSFSLSLFNSSTTLLSCSSELSAWRLPDCSAFPATSASSPCFRSAFRWFLFLQLDMGGILTIGAW